MAQINPSIPLSVRPPQRQQGAIGRLSQLSQLKNVQQQGKIQGMQLGQMEATQGRADAVRKILSQGLDPEQTYRQLLSVEPSAAAKFQLNQVTQGAADFQVMGGVFASMIGKTQEERQAMGQSLGRMLEASGRWQLAQQILSYGWTDAEIDAGLALVRNAENTLKGNAPLKVGATERVFAEGGAGEELVSALPKEPTGRMAEYFQWKKQQPKGSDVSMGAWEKDIATQRRAPTIPVPGRDIPYSPAVQAQRVETATASAGGATALEAYAGALASGSMAVTAVPTQVRGEVVSYMESNNIPIVTPTQAAEGRKASKTDPIYKEIKTLSDRINVKSGLGAYVTGLARKGAAEFNYDDDVRIYEDLIKGFTPLVARALGHTGVLTEMDVQSTRSIFPRPEDSESVAKAKLKLVEDIMQGVEAAIMEGRGATGVGKDADPKELSDDELLKRLLEPGP